MVRFLFLVVISVRRLDKLSERLVHVQHEQTDRSFVRGASRQSVGIVAYAFPCVAFLSTKMVVKRGSDGSPSRGRGRLNEMCASEYDTHTLESDLERRGD